MQYLHQVRLLTILPALVVPALIPPAVDAELAVRRSLELDLPDPAQLGWLTIRPLTHAVSTSLPPGLDAGEAEVLALALECGDAVVVLDDALAHQAAQSLGVRLMGTLGLLLTPKHQIDETGLPLLLGETARAYFAKGVKAKRGVLTPTRNASERARLRVLSDRAPTILRMGCPCQVEPVPV